VGSVFNATTRSRAATPVASPHSVIAVAAMIEWRHRIADKTSRISTLLN